MWRHTARVTECLTRLEVHTPNRSGLPIVEIPLRDHERIGEVGQLLFDRGVYVTLAAYPLVPREEVGFRVQLTAANTDAEIDTLIAALEELAGMGELRPVDQESAPPIERVSAPSVEQASATTRVGGMRHRREMRMRERPPPSIASDDMIARYRALFSTPGVGRLLVSSVVGRLPSGMFSLAILLFVHGSTGSFLVAGLAVGAFSLAGAADRPAAGGAGRSARADAGAAGSRARPGGVAGGAGARRRRDPRPPAGGGDRRAGGAGGRRAAADRGLRACAVVGGRRRRGAADRLRPGRHHPGDDLDARPTAGGR